MGFLNRLFGKQDDPYAEYTSGWFRRASDEELQEEREKVRLRHCKGDERAMLFLSQFDRETGRRYAEEHKDDPPKPRVYREHGWYLPNDD